MLENKVAVVYGGAGSIGSAVARKFADEGAQVFLAGRTESALDEVATDIRATGGDAETAVVDATDEQSVEAFVDATVEDAGRIDISFNAIGYGDVQKPLMELSVAEFLQPITTAARTQFLTTRAVARPMMERGGGVVLFFGGGGPQTLPGVGGLKVALDAVEGVRRQWAVELGEYGVRAVTLKTGGITETVAADVDGRDEIVAGIENETLLGRGATLEDVQNVAAFVASDQARSMTATEVNISCGGIPE